MGTIVNDLLELVRSLSVLLMGLAMGATCFCAASDT